MRKYISIVSLPVCDVVLCYGKPSKWIPNPIFLVLFIPYKGSPWSHISWISRFYDHLSQQAFEYLFLFRISEERAGWILIYSLWKFHNVGEKIEGNINFFWKSEVMFRREYKKPCRFCLAFIWIHFEQSIKNKKHCCFSLFRILKCCVGTVIFVISWVCFFRPWVILAKTYDFNPKGQCQQDNNWVWVYEKQCFPAEKTDAKDGATTD